MCRLLALLLAGLALLAPVDRTQAADPAAVYAGSQAVSLHSFLEGDFGLFSQSGPTDIVLRLPFNVRWVDVRPKSLGIAATVDSDRHTVRFRSPHAAPLTVEFNDDLSHVIHLFAQSPELDAPRPGDPNLIYFGPGHHEAGEIELRSGQTLYLAAGAWVRGHIRCVGAHGVAIRGRGVLDGSDPRPLWTDPGKAASPPRAGPLTAEQRAAAYHLGQGDVIYLDQTEGVTIEGITLFDSPGWTLVVRRSHAVSIASIAILNPAQHYGDDGIDIVSSSRVRIRNCFIRTNDDCVAVKNLDDRPTGDIDISGCVLWNMPLGGNGLEVGFENGLTPISQVRFRDIDLIHVQRGAAISLHAGDAGTIADVSYRDLRVEDARRKLIDFAVLYAQYGLDQPATAAERRQRIDRGGVWDGEETLDAAQTASVAPGRGRIQGVSVHNLAVVDGTLPYSIIAGFDARHPVENVIVSGLSYRGQPIATAAEGKFVIENAPGFQLIP